MPKNGLRTKKPLAGANYQISLVPFWKVTGEKGGKLVWCLHASDTANPGGEGYFKRRMLEEVLI